MSPYLFRMSNSRRGCNISKQPSSSKLSSNKMKAPSSGVSTISTISPILKISKYLIPMPKVSNFNHNPSPFKMERCHTMDDGSSNLIKLEKVEKINVTPASGLKKKPYIDFTNVPKKNLMKNLIGKSPLEVIPKSNRKKKDVIFIEKLARKQSNLIYSKSMLKKNKKPKVKKGTIKKKTGVKKLKTVRNNDSRSQNAPKRLDRNMTYDEQAPILCYDDSAKNASKVNLVNAIYGLRNRTAAKEYSKNVKSFIENCSGISEKYTKARKVSKKQPETSFDVYKRKFSGNEVKKITVTAATKKPSKNNLIDYVNLCSKLKSRDTSVGREKTYSQINQSKQAFVNNL